MHAQESRIVKSGLWLYISQLSYAIGGFIFWYVISLLSGSETVGIVSSIMGLATIITSLRTLGTGTSLQKFLGEALGKNDRESFNSYLWTTIFFNLATAFATAILLIFLSILNIKIAGLDNLMLIFTSILTILQLSNILISILNSMLQTKYVAISAIIYNVAMCSDVSILKIIWYIIKNKPHIVHYNISLNSSAIREINRKIRRVLSKQGRNHSREAVYSSQ